MCNYKLTVTISKNSEIVDGGGWVTSMTWNPPRSQGPCPGPRRQRVDRPPGNSRRRKTKGGGPMRKAVNIICGILAEVCALAVILLGAYIHFLTS